MTTPGPRIPPLRAWLAAELHQLLRFSRSDRPWEMPLVAALASALPVAIALALGEPALGLTAALGGLVFLYLPATALAHRMAWLMACAFGLVACYALGIVSQVHAPLTVPMLGAVTLLVTLVCRFYAVPPPGTVFFVMAAAIAAYTPAQGAQSVLRVGLIAMGCVLAVGIAFAYSLYRLRRAPPLPPPVAGAGDPTDRLVDAVVIAGAVALSLALAQLLQLPRPYWVPVSCLAVVQGVTARAVWTRQVHRIGGTLLGLLVFRALALLPVGDIGVVLLLLALAFVVETLVVRHYGLAVVFITPLTLLLAEGAQGLGDEAQALMHARLLDTVLGASVGLAGGLCLHSPRVRAGLGGLLNRLGPRRRD